MLHALTADTVLRSARRPARCSLPGHPLRASSPAADDAATAIAAADADPLAPKPPHFAAKAKRVIFLYMTGGVSHVDSFDSKPRLFADAGKTVPSHTRRRRRSCTSSARLGVQARAASAAPRSATCSPTSPSVVDDLCLIRSMQADHADHFQATLGIHTGSVTFARPSIGSWVSYGLGTVNQNLPSFVVLAPQLPYAGGQVWAQRLPPRLPPGHARARPAPSRSPT